MSSPNLIKIFAVLCIGGIMTGCQTQKFYRGFTTQKYSLENLDDMKNDWNANIVRYMLRPIYVSQKKNLPTYMDGWNEILHTVPAYLDRAEKDDMLVVLAFFGVPNEKAKKYPKDRQEYSAAFWDDDENLKVLIECWQQVAEICKDRKQFFFYPRLVPVSAAAIFKGSGPCPLGFQADLFQIGTRQIVNTLMGIVMR